MTNVPPGSPRATASPPSRSWGPEVEGRGRPPLLLRLGRPALRTLLVVVVVTLALGPWWVSGRIPRVPVAGLADGGRPLHVLITGSDSREGLSPEERAELSTGSASGDRADTILVLSVEGTRASLVAFPRDLLVTRCDGSVGRINAAIGIGGPSCLVETVRRVSGIPVQHHLAITFGGFRDVVDAVGGVRLCLDDPIRDRDAGIDLPAGCQVLDGADALGYVRVRKIDDDLQRIARQQRFLAALARELVDPTLVLRPWRVVALANGIGSALTADEALGPTDLVRLALGLRALAGGTAATATVPADPGTTDGGAFVFRLREPDAERLFASVRDGSLLRSAPSPDDGGDVVDPTAP